MKKIVAYEIIDHGVEHSQYFQGCGTYGTEYDEVFIGVGNSLKEALSDAAEQIIQFDSEIQLSNDLEQDIQNASDKDEVSVIIERDRPEPIETVILSTFSGMRFEMFSGTLDECNEYCKNYLKTQEQEGFTVTDLASSQGDFNWVITGSDNQTMISDKEGYLSIVCKNLKEIMDYERQVENSELAYFASIRVKYE